MKLSSVLLLLMMVLLNVVQGSRILVVAPHGTKSHHGMLVPIVAELARRGHQLTFINNYIADALQNVENVTDLIIDEMKIDPTQFPRFDEIISPPSLINKMRLAYRTISVISKAPTRTAKLVFDDPRVRNLLIDNHQFDLLIISEANPFIGYAMAWHFKAPFILISPNTLIPGRAESLGDDEHYSYYPVFSTRFTDKMKLAERILNLITGKIFEWIHSVGPGPTVRSIVQKKGIPNCPPMHEIGKDVSLIFTYSHPTFTYSRTLPPKIVEIGGLHCRPAKPLKPVRIY